MFAVFCVEMLLIPILLLGFGALLRNSPPPKPDRFFGYRSKRAMQNETTWLFAQRYCGFVWMRLGVLLLIAAILFIFYCYLADIIITDAIILLPLAIQLLLLLASIAVVEYQLQRQFPDKTE